jgi:hypothetical protein
MREIRSSGSVEGVLGDGHLYSDSPQQTGQHSERSRCLHPENG